MNIQRKIVTGFLGIILILLSVYSCFAQNNSYSKGFFSLNASDTVALQNARTTLQTSYGNTGGLYFNKVSNKWRIWDGSAWTSILTESGGNFWPLTGTGTLTGNVNISGAFNVNLGVPTSLSAFNVNATQSIISGGTQQIDLSTAGNILFTGKARFTPSATLAGLNVGSFAGNPSSPVNGDIWFNSSTNRLVARNGATGTQDILTANVISSQMNLLNPAQTFSYTIAVAGIGASQTITVPNINSTGNGDFVIHNAAQTLSNKTLGAATVHSAIPSINDGITFTFNPNATVSGLNVGSNAGFPSTLVNGDLFYNSSTNTFGVRAATSNRDLVMGTLTSTRIPYATAGNVLSDNALFIWDNPNNDLYVGSTATGTNGLQIQNDQVISGMNGATAMQIQNVNSSVGNGADLTITAAGSTFSGGAGGNIILTPGIPTVGNANVGNINFNMPSPAGTGSTGSFNITQSSSAITNNSKILSFKTTATNDDPTIDIYQNRIATTDATVTTLHTYTLPSSTTALLKASIVARRTGGTGGTAEDGAGYVIMGTYKNVAGTATLIGAVLADYTAESVAGYDATFTVSGATVLVRVTGVLNTNITWHLSNLEVNIVSN